MSARPAGIGPSALAAGLLLCGVAAHWAPEHLAAWHGGSVRAWETVCYGIEAALLWLVVAALSACVWRSWLICLPVSAVCGCMAAEGLQRGACRLLWPMQTPVRFDQPLCVVAFGPAAEWLGVAGALAAVAVVARSVAHGR